MTKDGKVFVDSKEFVKWLEDDGEIINTVSIPYDNSHTRVIETWDLKGQCFFTARDVSKCMKPVAGPKGVALKWFIEETERVALLNVDCNMRGYIPKEEWEVSR